MAKERLGLGGEPESEEGDARESKSRRPETPELGEEGSKMGWVGEEGRGLPSHQGT